MPRILPDHGEPATSSASHCSPRTGTRGIRTFILWLLLSLAIAAIILLITSRSRVVAGGSTPDLHQLSGFQKRGNALIGEVRTRDGATLRLVFDARTQTLIGFRLVESAAPAGACPGEGATLPLPASAEPAN